MMRLLVLILLFGLSTEAFALKLKETPVQDAMSAQLLADEWDDEPTETLSDVDSDNGFQADVGGKKSVFRAGLYSAILPGAGEYYLGKRKKARLFFAAEALTWVGYVAFRTQGNWKKDDYIRYGNTFAGASLDDKDDEFLDLVGFYESIDLYNDLGRVWDRDRPYLADTPENHWVWQSPEHQATYREIKNESGEAYRRADFMIGVAIVSRIVSIIDSVRDAIRHNRKVSSGFARTDGIKFKFDVNPLQSDRIVSLTLYPNF